MTAKSSPDWYLDVGRALGRHIQGDAFDPSNVDHAAWISSVMEVLESGARHIEVPAHLSRTGKPVKVLLPRDTRLPETDEPEPHNKPELATAGVAGRG